MLATRVGHNMVAMEGGRYLQRCCRGYNSYNGITMVTMEGGRLEQDRCAGYNGVAWLLWDYDGYDGGRWVVGMGLLLLG